LAYYDNYLIDTHSRVILAVEATPARFRQETIAARRMLGRVEKLGLHPDSVGADKAYGSGEFLAWLLARDIQPHIPVIDRRHQTGGRFTRDAFRYEPQETRTTAQKENHCIIAVRGAAVRAISIAQRKPNAKGVHRKSFVLEVHIGDCLFIGRSQRDRQFGALAGTPAYKQSQRARYKIEALFAELKQQMSLRRVRLRRTWNVAEQFLLAATAQNLKRMVRFLAQREASALSTA